MSESPSTAARTASPGLLRRGFERVLRVVRRASRAVWLGVTVMLLAIVYVTLVPVLAVSRRLGATPGGAWRVRSDADVTSLARLRSLY